MKYGLIGEKLGHSFSKEIHQQLFDYSYELKEIEPAKVERYFQQRAFSAINVTIPYKETVIPFLDAVDEVAESIGAVNTVVNRDGKLYGYNTDFLGLKALILHAGMNFTDKTVLVLGSGGTSKTAMAVAKALNCRQAMRVSRTKKDGCITYEQAIQQYQNAEYIINTTPCGMYPNIGESAVNLVDFPSLEGVVDVVYNPLRSKLVCDALSRGVPATGGLYMLVAQAAYAAQLFTGKVVPAERIDPIYNELISKKQNLVLIGMPGCGKTTIGKALAQQIGLAFVDTDEEIVRVEKRTIPEIFSADGEMYFRQVESAVIRQISLRQGCVIATGGGAVLNPENMALLRENGRLYFLDRSLENLCATADRPLSANKTALEQRYHERYALYCHECDQRIPANANIDAVIKHIREDLIE
ncbi:MAG: AAA family ATPase [Ruminococcaceae bacterium]|nr:AAA family ATPase [Oscillospiraceae bacterium]